MLDTHIKPDLLARVESALDAIRPYLVKDGGNVEVAGILPDMTLELRLIGNCSDCHMSHMTMRAGIEKSVLKAVPEIQRVIALNQLPHA